MRKSEVSNKETELLINEKETLQRELRLLRQQSQELIEQSKQLENPDTYENVWPWKPRVTWQFIAFVSILLLAFIGTISNIWTRNASYVEIENQLHKLNAENELLKLEVFRLQNEIINFKKTYTENAKENVESHHKNRLARSSKNVDDSCNGGENDLSGFCVNTEKTAGVKRPELNKENPSFDNKQPSDPNFKQQQKYKNKPSEKKEFRQGKRKNNNSSEEKNDKFKNNHSNERKNKKYKDSSKERKYNSDEYKENHKKYLHSGERNGKHKRSNSKEYEKYSESPKKHWKENKHFSN